MKVHVNAFKIIQRGFLSKDHLVETWHKICVEEPPVEYGKSKTSPDEFEVVEVLRIDGRHPVDLKSVIIMCRVSEQAV